MNEGAALGLVLDQVSKDKNIDRHVLVETLEQAILTAAKRAFGMQREMEAKFNEETGRVDLFQIIVIAEQVTEETKGKEISIEDANRFNLKAEIGDELLFQIFYDEKDQAKAEEQDAKYGLLLELNRAWKGFGRIAAQTAKQVILQRVREAERENVFNQYKDRKGELISGIVRRFERGNIIVDLGGAEALLPVRDQVPRERPHRRLRHRHRQGRARAADHPVAHEQGTAREALRDGGPRDLREDRAHRGLGPRGGRALEDRRQLARSRRRSRGRLRRHEGLARAGGRAGAARREDRHRALRRRPREVRVQRHRARRGRARPHRR